MHTARRRPHRRGAGDGRASMQLTESHVLARIDPSERQEPDHEPIEQNSSRRRNWSNGAANGAARPSADSGDSSVTSQWCVLPVPTGTLDNYVPSRWFGKAGLDLNEPQQLARLERWRRDEVTRSCTAFCATTRRSTARLTARATSGSTCLHNGWYPTPDAEIYASMINEARPGPNRRDRLRIQHADRPASAAVSAGHDAQLTVIDPAPRTDVEQVADKVIYQRVEDARLDDIGLTNRSILFIDSSHVTRPRGDVPYLYCEVLPQLPAGTIVHVHDIFIPYDYPDQLRPAVLDRAVRAARAVGRQQAISSAAGDAVPVAVPRRGDAGDVWAAGGRDDLFYGASFWFQVR